MPIMGARLVIGDLQVADTWDGSDVVALSDMTILWGRDSPYDDVEASNAHVTLLDRSGLWSVDSDRIGQTLIIWRTNPDRILFRGRIATVRLDLIRIHNPATGRSDKVWKVDVTGTDTLGELAMAVVPGPAAAESYEGLGGWGEVKPDTRIDTLLEYGADQYLAGIDHVSPPPEGLDRYLKPKNASDKDSLLQLITAAYKVSPLGFVDYDPHENRIHQGNYTQQTVIALVLAAGQIQIVSSGARLIPASKVLVPDGYGLESTVADAIDIVQLPHRRYQRDPNAAPDNPYKGIYQDPIIEAPTSRAGTNGKRVLQVEVDVIEFDEYLFGLPPGGYDRFNLFPAWLLSQIIPIVEGFNEQLRLPTLRLDFERFDYGDADTVSQLVDPRSRPIPLFFPGSVYNRFPKAGPQFQIIGGTLRYRDGWTHDINLVASKPQASTKLTVNQLVTNTAPTLSDFAPALTLSDLATVNDGLDA